jgi:hypothetical protein
VGYNFYVVKSGVSALTAVEAHQAWRNTGGDGTGLEYYVYSGNWFIYVSCNGVCPAKSVERLAQRTGGTLYKVRGING